MKAIICDICKRPLEVGENGINFSETVEIKETKRKFRAFVYTGEERVKFITDMDICEECLNRIKREAQQKVTIKSNGNIAQER